MTATWKEPLDAVIDILKADHDSVTKKGWNRANTDNVKPVILDIASDGPERGKRLDLQRHDYILCYETALNEEVPDLLYNFVTTRVNITVDMRTTRSRSRLRKMENEMRRIIHVNRKGDGENFDRMILKVRTDLSDRTKKLFRHTFQVEVVILAEAIP
jgi:hypothetical protein|tara:strand:+ start:174 stop:647 length:474 start_codon:yes stop_codon:yes gene_type:complete